MQSQQGFADVNGARLYYEVAGEGEPLVFVHGRGLDTRMWDDQFARFAERYCVLRYDLRGFGRSAVPSEQPYSHSDDLKVLLATLGMEPAVTVGLSGGGRIVVDFALTYPEATRALVAVDAALTGWQWSSEFNAAERKIADAVEEGGVDAGKAAYLANALFAPALEQPAIAARLVEMVKDYSGWHWLNADPRRLPDPPAAQRLDRIRVPTLVLVGERDIDDCRRIADLLEQEIPGARKVVLAGVGHMANMEAPEQFNDVLLRFLSTS